MDCPHCHKPLNRFLLPLQFSAVQTCPECKNPYIIKYDWKMMGIVAAIGFVISVVGMTVLFENPPEMVLLAAVVAIFMVSAMFAARPQKQKD